MRPFTILLALALIALCVSISMVDTKQVRQLANYHRLATNNVLLDLDTGLHVSCDTDTDCYQKTGINP